GMAMPLATQIMMAMGEFLQAWWWVLLGGMVAVWLGIRMYVKTERGQKVWDSLKLRLPLVGMILKKIEIARFSRTLGTLLGSGVSILMSMRIVRGVVINTVLGAKLDVVYQDLKQGRMLSRSIEKTGVFPALSVHMVGVGEETGRLEIMLNKVADIYDKELRATIKTLTSMLEPIIILAMGLVIGAMIVSMLLAIFSVNDINV
ncbi:MAG: type II secretion system F family protein, partial [Deltaproteobacteria bacterium]|nr:type II secretion system F family protein [Deltaproteobacteria bacterium]